MINYKMGISFHRKQKKKQDTTENQGINKAFRIILKEKLSKGTTRTIKVFDAGRWKDPLDGVIYLKSIENQSNKINFLEIYPGDVKGFIKSTEKEVEKKIKEYELKLEKENNIDDPNVNQKNFEYELLKLYAQKRAITYNNDASYVTYGEDGQPEIIYLRESDYFTPFKWDTETDTIYQPSEAKKKSVVSTLRNKESKYKNNDKVTATAIILLIAGIVLTLGNIFGGLKLWTMYDESKIAELEASSLNTLDVCSKTVAQTNKELVITAGEIRKISESMAEKSTNPIIGGIIPQ